MTGMRIFPGFRLGLFLAVLAAGPVALAQNVAQEAEPEESLELIDETEQPTITIRKPDAAREITERRENGEVKEVKVQTGVSTYYLYPNQSLGGSFDDGTSKRRPAMWRIHEFDVTGQRPDQAGSETEEEFDYTSDAPVPPVSK